ncbi:MAG: UDP-glucose 4-epimerase GalE [Candidatus Gastranaerophilaceae bacterium]|jgi:UDP-glucose 4-epimerase
MILIVGGAGYIGSHCVLDLTRNGYDCLVLDNLSKGHIEAIKTRHFVKADLSNISALRDVFKKYPIEAVIHFAADACVGESVTNPQKYYYNNVVNTLNLLSVMIENNVKNIVFSSTCATYGNPEYVPIDEKHIQNPINPYGRTKLIIENIFKDYDNAYGLKYIALRYFNAAGADILENIGESHSPETHLIPLVLQASKDENISLKVFGNDYDTPDGTCLRDYIHVNDLARAHRLALEKLLSGADSDFYNLGTGKGTSVLEIIDLSSKITGKNISYELAPRRAGDPPALVASNNKAKEELGWEAEFVDPEEIIKTAWKWESNKHF